MTRKYRKVDKEEKKPHQQQQPPRQKTSSQEVMNDQQQDILLYQANPHILLVEGNFVALGAAMRNVMRIAAQPPVAVLPEVVDEEGLHPDEIGRVIHETGCTRAQAVRALRRHGDIVDAILSLLP
jgi:NACalpha-BTF3-like transcription factor